MSPCELQKMSTADALMTKPFPPAMAGVCALMMDEAKRSPHLAHPWLMSGGHGSQRCLNACPSVVCTSRPAASKSLLGCPSSYFLFRRSLTAMLCGGAGGGGGGLFDGGDGAAAGAVGAAGAAGEVGAVG